MALKPELIGTHDFTGTVEWIGVAPGRRKDLQTPDFVDLVENEGIVGEHHRGNRTRSHRQVTLIQQEHIAAISRLLKRKEIDPALLRRNIVVSGINLAVLKESEFTVGDVVLQGTGDCHPCALMDHTLGAGGYEAMAGHGGITAIVLTSGRIVLKSPVRLRKLTTG